MGGSDEIHSTEKNGRYQMNNQIKQSLQSILKAHEMLMLEQNGRPDCKNCVLAETIKEFLDNEVSDE